MSHKIKNIKIAQDGHYPKWACHIGKGGQEQKVTLNTIRCTLNAYSMAQSQEPKN